MPFIFKLIINKWLILMIANLFCFLAMGFLYLNSYNISVFAYVGWTLNFVSILICGYSYFKTVNEHFKVEEENEKVRNMKSYDLMNNRFTSHCIQKTPDGAFIITDVYKVAPSILVDDRSIFILDNKGYYGRLGIEYCKKPTDEEVHQYKQENGIV